MTITREELLRSPEFWLTKIQNILFQEVKKYLKKKDINQTDFAKELQVSKGYVSQVLNGDYDHKLSKFLELSLAIGKVPIIRFENIETYIAEDEFKYSMQESSFNYYSIKNIDTITVTCISTAKLESGANQFTRVNNLINYSPVIAQC